MIHPIFVAVLVIGLLIATLRDLQIREVPDTVSYGLIAFGILGGLILSVLERDVRIFLEHATGFLGAALIGIAMFYTRQWGGGDAKLMMGIGAVVGMSGSNLLLPAFLVLLLLSGAVYGMIYTAGLALMHRKRFWKAFTKRLRTRKVHRLRIGLVGTGVVILLLIVFVNLQLKILLGFFLLGLYVLMYSYLAIKSIEETILLKKYPVGKLTEGDWVAEEVRVRGKVLVPERNTALTKEQIGALKKHRIRTVMVREGIPFVPAFLIAFVLLMLITLLVHEDPIGILLMM